MEAQTINHRLVPWDSLELAKMYHVLRGAGYDPERLARVEPSQIVYAFDWKLDGQGGGSTPQETVIPVSNNDASIITDIQFSVTHAELGGNSIHNIEHFNSTIDPLDYVSMQVRQTASEQLSTGYVPCSHWSKNARGWMPSILDFVPGGNYSSYELAFRTDKDFTFRRLFISLKAIQLVGL